MLSVYFKNPLAQISPVVGMTVIYFSNPLAHIVISIGFTRVNHSLRNLF